LFSALAQQDIYWRSQSSINISFEKALLELAARSGCEYLSLGFESTQEESLKLFNKQLNLSRKDQYKGIFSNIRSYGIGIMGSFILCNDSDTKDSF